MAYEPLFSILVANYNNGHFFKDCYKSIIAQTYQNWECIIVDDQSTDNSLELIQNLIGNDSRFKIYVNKVNKGVGFTKKNCIDFSNGEYCVFIDPDDAVRIDALEVMNKLIEENPNHSIYYSNFIYCNENLIPQEVRKTIQVDKKDFYNFKGIISALAVFSKKDYLKTDGLNDQMKRAIDQDLYLKLYDVSEGKVLYINEDLYFYRIHNNGISTNTNGERAYFWHWVAAIKAAERRGINIEDLFVENFKSRDVFEQNKKKINLLKQSKWLKLGYKLGLFKGYKYL